MKQAWPMVSLAELVTLERRPVEVAADTEYREIGVYCFGRGIFHKQPRSGLEVGDKKLYLLREGDVILQVTFAWEGAIALCSDKEEGLYGSTRYPTFRVNEARCLPFFLVRYLCTHDGLRQINRICPGSAGRNRVLAINRLSEVLVPLPPLEEQRRIVARIEELAAKIAEARLLREQTLVELEALHSSAVSSALDSMRSQMKTVDEMVGRDALRNGKSVKSTGEDGAIRCLTLSSIRRGRIDMTHSKPVPLPAEDARQFTVRRRDVFIVRGNGSKHLCGQAGLVQDESENVVFPDLFIRVPLPETLLPEFFVAVWNSGAVRAEIEDKAKTTSGIWKINQTHIASTRIPVPTLAEQHRLVAYLDGLDRKADALKRLQGETATELDAMLPAILDRAFKGEL